MKEILFLGLVLIVLSFVIAFVVHDWFMAQGMWMIA